MGVRQISVFLENKAGRLSDVTKVLGDNNVDISALSIADTAHFGILRLIVNNPDLAETVLKKNGYTVSISNVIAIAIDDNPGALAKALEVLTDEDITIEYIYAFTGKTENKALVVLKVEDIEKATELLRSRNIRVLDDSEVYSL
ncbi:MAG TPA: ACT domain-containing protein [Clostridia bacterium]|jgi:hypothetical protein|nr:ACT domain-containing protein [Clostridiaceae bacterium]HOA31228.1 ACT domain-containing protein [Clostridia bacterium]HPZ52271.1 ACT domain-containing protein [Clostridia bacterium]